MKMIPMFENLLNIKLLNNEQFKQLLVIIKWKINNLIMNVESNVIGHVQVAKHDVNYFHIKCCDELKFAEFISDSGHQRI